MSNVVKLKPKKRAVPKNRNSEIYNDCDYLHKLSPAEREWRRKALQAIAYGTGPMADNMPYGWRRARWNEQNARYRDVHNHFGKSQYCSEKDTREATIDGLEKEEA